MRISYKHTELALAMTNDSTYKPLSSIHGVFLRNRLYLGLTGVTSFRVQFEKVGRGLVREAKRREGEWALLVEAKGDEKRKML